MIGMTNASLTDVGQLVREVQQIQADLQSLSTLVSSLSTRADNTDAELINIAEDINSIQQSLAQVSSGLESLSDRLSSDEARVTQLEQEKLLQEDRNKSIGNAIAMQGWNQQNINNMTSGTESGVTFTNQGDGSWKLNGTATEVIRRSVCDKIHLIPGHKFYMSGGLSSTVFLYMADSSFGGFRMVDEGAGVIGTASHNGDANIRIGVGRGNTVTNVIVKPMVVDLTEVFGAGHEPADVSKVRELLSDDFYKEHKLHSIFVDGKSYEVVTSHTASGSEGKITLVI